MTPSSISGRSSPSTDRAVVVSSSVPSSIRLTTVRAVKPFMPLAIANRVSVAFGIECALIREPVRLRQLDTARAVDTHDTGEPGVLGDRVDGVLERLHRLNLATGVSRDRTASRRERRDRSVR